MNKLKNKILFGLIFLLLIIILLSVTGILSIYYLSRDSEAILSDNYASVGYSSTMLHGLQDIFLTETSNTDQNDKALKDILFQKRKEFEHNLFLQGKNITEPGEDSLFSALTKEYKEFISLSDSLMNPGAVNNPDLHDRLMSSFSNTEETIRAIYDVNMKAINMRSAAASETADNVMMYMGVSAGISILLTIIFIFYFPGYLVSPIKELTGRIRDISNKKFDQRIIVPSGGELKDLADAFNLMAAGLKKYEAERINELLYEKRRMETLVLNLKDSILLLDKEKNILLANDKFCELTSNTREQLLGLNIKDLPGSDPITESVKQLAFSSPETVNRPVEIHSEGKTEYFRTALFEIESEERGTHKKIPGEYIVLVQNVTEYRERDFAKTNMIATISHELKTPLSSINLSLKLLEDERIGYLNDEQKKMTYSIRQHSTRILQLINEVLNFAQAETGHITLSIRPNNVHDLIELGTFAVLMLINEKHIDLKPLMPENLPPVKCDLEKSVWVLVNLLTNAVRYSTQGSRIDMTAEKKDSFIEISVKDYGPGISPEEQTRIFEKYVK